MSIIGEWQLPGITSLLLEQKYSLFELSSLRGKTYYKLIYIYLKQVTSKYDYFECKNMFNKINCTMKFRSSSKLYSMGNGRGVEYRTENKPRVTLKTLLQF